MRSGLTSGNDIELNVALYSDSGVSMIPVEKLEADPELKHLLNTKSVRIFFFSPGTFTS